MESSIQDWIISVMNDFGYFGIALLIAIENIFPPIPSEVILTFGGFMTSKSEMNVWLVALSATIGSLVGALALYYIGTLVTPSRLGALIDKWGKVIRVKKQDVKKAEGWFIRKGKITVFFCRFIPIVRSLISIPAGMSRMPLGEFLIYTTLGTAIWNIVLVNLGAYLGENWETILKYMETYTLATVVVLGVLGICFLFWLFRKKPVEDNSSEDDLDNK